MSIWNSKIVGELGKDIATKLSLNEGYTPLEEKVFNKANNIAEFPKTILFKREDKNPTGSFKDRSIAYELSYQISKGIVNFAISSSGNAGISACEYLHKNQEIFKNLSLKINLKVFVANSLIEEKISKLKAYELLKDSDIVNIDINLSDKPTSNCIKYSNETHAFNLRSSNDDNAIVGYLSLGEEIALLDFDSIFITSSSGSSAIGIYLGYLMTKYPLYFKDLNTSEFSLDDILHKLPDIKIENLPKLYICQTTKVHPIAKEFDSDFQDSPSSLINSVVDRVAKRKEEVIDIVKFSGGSGFVISDNDVSDAEIILKNNGIDIPLNSICAFSGLIKSLKKGNIIRRPLIIVSGK